MAQGVSCLLVLAFVCLVQCASNYPTFSNDGFEVIFLDKPSFLSQIYHSHTDAALYVFGQNTLRIVETYPNFSVHDNPNADWNQPFISLHTFHNGTDLWGIGPTFPSDYSASTEGYTLPLALVGPTIYHTQRVQGLDGCTFFNLFSDTSNKNDVLSYLVGWIPVNGSNNETAQQVAFAVVRTHINFNAPFMGRRFTFDPVNDVLPLAFNRFTPYSQHFKPHIHWDNDTNIFIVVDPATSTIYTLQGTVPLTKLRAEQIYLPGTITGSLFHAENNLLYLGFAAQGIGNGTVVSVDIGTMTIQNSITFNEFSSNPRAIAIDEPTDTLYVAFNGGDHLYRLNYLLQITGYQRVPFYINHLEAAAVGEEHVYFITNEQHSKVLRVNKTDFCPSMCPLFGFCRQGKCECDRFFKPNADNTRCELDIGSTTVDKGAAIALGVLFALTFVAAVLGWFLFWRGRKTGYQSV